jgi:hypothetical protein
MSEVVPTEIAVGDQVRVHFHPPGSWKSFSEGVVRRVDVTTPAGRFFVLEVRSEVLLDQPHRIRPNFHDYVQYERRKDFPGRIEVLSPAADMEQVPVLDLTLMDPRKETKQEANEPLPVGSETHAATEVERASETEFVPKPTQVEIDRQPVPARTGLIAALFGRKE